MAIRATVTGELARCEQVTGPSILIDVAVSTKFGMVNVIGFSRDLNVAKGFKVGSLVCMQGSGAAFNQFNDDVTFQLRKVTALSYVKERLDYVQIEADGRLARAEADECDNGTEVYKVQLDIKTSFKRDQKDPEFDKDDKSTWFHSVDVPLYALCVGQAFKQAEDLVEEEASRVSLVGYMERIEPLWVEGVDEPCISMVATKAVAGTAATGNDFWTSKPKAPTSTALPKAPVLIQKKSDPNDQIPF